MKIMYLCPRFVATVSGVETYLDNLIMWFGASNEIHLVTRLEKPVRKLDKYKNLVVHYVEGFDSTKIDIYKVLPELGRIVGEIEPDLIHVHCVMSLLMLKLATDITKYPLVVTLHSTPDGQKRLFGWFSDFRTEIAFCRSVFKGLEADAVIFGSEYYKKQYLSVCPEMESSKLMAVNPYYSSLPGLELEKRLEYIDQRKEQVNILFPSRIIYRKGIEDALEMLSLLPDNYQLSIPCIKNVEKQEYTQRIYDMVCSLGIKDRVIFPDHQVFHEEMDLFYKDADIVIIPSHYEGFGIVAVEAMDYGVPVISTCVDGLSEIVVPGENGLSVAIKDAIGMAEAVKLLCEDVNLMKKFAFHGKETANRHFSRAKHMKVIEDIYNESYR